LSQPRGIALDAAGNDYVADFGNDRIQKFGPDFAFLKEWGARGDLPSHFKQPGDVAVGPDGLVYVADTWNQRIQVFPSASIKVPGSCCCPWPRIAKSLWPANRSRWPISSSKTASGFGMTPSSKRFLCSGIKRCRRP
jgi:DNA-binding beta-propeller fold protein YncE